MKHLAIAMTIFFAGSLSGFAQAQKAFAETFQLGDKLILIPAPNGFEEAASQFEAIKKHFTLTEDPGNDMLAVHLPIADCEKLRRGESGSFNFYTKISIRKGNREKVISDQEFENIVAEFRKSSADVLDINSPKMKETLEHLEKSLNELRKEETKLEMSQPVNLGEFDTRPNVYCVMLLINLKYQSGGEPVTKPIVGGLCFVRVKQKLLYVYTYHKYESKTDIEILRDFTKQWITKILAAN